MKTKALDVGRCSVHRAPCATFAFCRLPFEIINKKFHSESTAEKFSYLLNEFQFNRIAKLHSLCIELARHFRLQCSSFLLSLFLLLAWHL